MRIESERDASLSKLFLLSGRGYGTMYLKLDKVRIVILINDCSWDLVY